MAAQDDLLKQILGQGLTSKWSGEGLGGAEANAKEMARILDSIGITDIKQFGKVPKYSPISDYANTTKDYYKGRPVEYTEDGQPYVNLGDTGGEAPEIKRITPEQVEKVRGQYTYDWDNNGHFVPLDESKVVKKDGEEFLNLGTTFGNKETGQAVPYTYGDRQSGDFFGGTFAGKGNTGYGVQFDAQGNPYFYTQGASNSDLGKIAPLLTMASFIPGLQPFAMAANAAIAAKQGDVLGALAGAAGLGGFTDVANAARMGKALQSGDPLAIALSGANMGGVTDIGGIDLKDISKGIGAVKAIESGDPLAMLRYGMGALPKDGGVSSLGPGTPEEFSEGLIPGYFQPGGEGYIASTKENVFDPTFGGTLPMPTETPTGPGVYDEITGKFIPGEGPLQGPLGPEAGNIDPNQKWEYDLVRPGVWANKDGEEIDVSYMPDRDVAQTGGDIMRRAGAMPGGSKAPAKTAAPAKPIAPTKPGAPTPTGTAPTTPATPNAPQQTSNADLLNLLGSKPELANIKSFKELFGDSLFGDTYVPPSAGGQQAGAEQQAELGMASQSEGEEQLFTGGHVDDFDVDALLRILRS